MKCLQHSHGAVQPVDCCALFACIHTWDTMTRAGTPSCLSPRVACLGARLQRRARDAHVRVCPFCLQRVVLLRCTNRLVGQGLHTGLTCAQMVLCVIQVVSRRLCTVLSPPRRMSSPPLRTYCCRPGHDGQDCWTIMVGSGVNAAGGAAMVYTAQDLKGGSAPYMASTRVPQRHTDSCWPSTCGVTVCPSLCVLCEQ